MSDREKHGKVTYVLQITAELERDGNYYGTGETLQWFLDRATNDAARSMTVLIQEGATEPKQVRASIRVERIVVTP